MSEVLGENTKFRCADGVEVEAYLVRPRASSGEAKAPGIVLVARTCRRTRR